MENGQLNADSHPDLTEPIPPEILELLNASGAKLIQQLGMDVIRDIIYDVLTGKNIRDSTEMLTRRRIAILNLAMTTVFIKGTSLSQDFVENLPQIALRTLQRKKLRKSEKWIAQWMLGLTSKGIQNILRDDPQALEHYKQHYVEVCQEIISEYEQEFGGLSGFMELDSGVRANIDWPFMVYLLNAVGAETLTIRGSEKSAYGKLFEKLVLGSLLHIMGFRHVKPPPEYSGPLNQIFWLSSDEKRESDATLLYGAGKGIRFDIGFIGRGNPEISLDKVTRFERELSLGSSRWYISTIIIVDRIGANSRIEELAEAVGGTIIQMSMNYWPQQVANELHRRTGYEHELVTMKQSDIGNYLRTRMIDTPLDDFIGIDDD